MEIGSLIGIALWALIPGFIARKKGRNFWGYYFLSFLISPLITMIIALCVKNLNEEYRSQQSTNTTQSTNHQATSPANTPGWQCSCGRCHPKYENSCICGKSKTDNLAPPLAETALPETHVASERILFCRKCGERLIDNSKFCRKCGTEVVKRGSTEDGSLC